MPKKKNSNMSEMTAKHVSGPDISNLPEFGRTISQPKVHHNVKNVSKLKMKIINHIFS